MVTIIAMARFHYRCIECGEEEQDIAHKIATAIREKNDLLIANLSSLR